MISFLSNKNKKVDYMIRQKSLKISFFLSFLFFDRM